MHFLEEYKKKRNNTYQKQMIEKQQYETYTVNEGDDTIYDIRDFDPDVMFPEEDVYKVKKNLNLNYQRD